MANGWGGRRGWGRWQALLLDLDRWVFVAELLPEGVGTDSYEYKALQRAAQLLADEGLIQIRKLHSGRFRVAVGPPDARFDLA